MVKHLIIISRIDLYNMTKKIKDQLELTNGNYNKLSN